MKKRDLERHLSANGCVLARQAANHEVWRNTATGQGADGATPQGDQASDRTRHLPPAGCASSNRVSLNTPGIGPRPAYGRIEREGGGVSLVAVGSLFRRSTPWRGASLPSGAGERAGNLLGANRLAPRARCSAF